MKDLGEPRQSHHIITGKPGSPLGVLSVINEHDNRFKQKFENSILERKRKLQGKQTANLTGAERMKKTSRHGGQPRGSSLPHGREGNFRKKK